MRGYPDPEGTTQLQAGLSHRDRDRLPRRHYALLGIAIRGVPESRRVLIRRDPGLGSHPGARRRAVDEDQPVTDDGER
jgi:hypothetical protein